MAGLIPEVERPDVTETAVALDCDNTLFHHWVT